MKVVFRADASLQIGTGHVMRCLTLADALASEGARCEFICRATDGNLLEFIRGKGYVTHALPACAAVAKDSAAIGADPNSVAHRNWLDGSQAEDAERCARVLAPQRPDWLIVDHYALDARWEVALAERYRKLMVIDDLADRLHACDLLLDQTFGRDAADYLPLVGADCDLLCGSQYALLRPDFAALRAYSLRRRRGRPGVRHLLITMGGVDNRNATGRVLRELPRCALPKDCRVTVVLGATAPWLADVREVSRHMPWATTVLVNASNMAQLMAESDLAIAAAGATSWERCCVGLPTIMFVLAENQRKIAEELSKAGAAHLVDSISPRGSQIITFEHLDPLWLSATSDAAAAITDGSGVARVKQALISAT